MDVGFDVLFIKDVIILASLSHLNLIKYYFNINSYNNVNEKCYAPKEKKKIFVFRDIIDATKFKQDFRRKYILTFFFINITY